MYLTPFSILDDPSVGDLTSQNSEFQISKNGPEFQTGKARNEVGAVGGFLAELKIIRYSRPIQICDEHYEVCQGACLRTIAIMSETNCRLSDAPGEMTHKELFFFQFLSVVTRLVFNLVPLLQDLS